MITIEEKLNLFSKHVFEDIKEEQEKKLKTIERHNREQMEDHKKKIEEEKKEDADKLIKRAKEKNKRKVSQKKGEVKKDIMLKKEEIFEELISHIKTKLREFRETSEYKDFLNKSLKEGLKELDVKDNIEVQISRRDEDNKDYIKGILKEKGFKEENISIRKSERNILGGAILIDKDKRISLDISLLQKLNENKEYIGRIFYETVDKVGEESGQ